MTRSTITTKVNLERTAQLTSHLAAMARTQPGEA
jgi:hypothetical protein